MLLFDWIRQKRLERCRTRLLKQARIAYVTELHQAWVEQPGLPITQEQVLEMLIWLEEASLLYHGSMGSGNLGFAPVETHENYLKLQHANPKGAPFSFHIFAYSFPKDVTVGISAPTHWFEDAQRVGKLPASFTSTPGLRMGEMPLRWTHFKEDIQTAIEFYHLVLQANQTSWEAVVEQEWLDEKKALDTLLPNSQFSNSLTKRL